MQTYPKEQPQPKVWYLNMTVVLTLGWAAWRWDCKVTSTCPQPGRGKSNFAPANSSNAGKILLIDHSIVISMANRNRSVLAQSREVTKCHENLVHLQTDACYQKHEFVLFKKFNTGVILHGQFKLGYQTSVFYFIPSVTGVYSTAHWCYKSFLTKSPCCTYRDRVLLINHHIQTEFFHSLNKMVGSEQEVVPYLCC